ncbi:hypothetical protein M9Y10_016046 [Tritrichomonas musculus]|uniref:Uncharacterized protein n=1 Tax=Tritrichomonas musculus TaxID=1915356 RepID=A0ABR2I5H3_9EUKA
MEKYQSDQLTSTSEVTCASVVIIPSIPIRRPGQETDSDTIPMAPISARAQSSRPFGSIQPSYRTAQTARNVQSSSCCILI